MSAQDARQPLDDDTGKITDERTAGPGVSAVLPPRNSSGPPSSVAPPARSAAMSSASHPPRRCERNAAAVTGIALSPAVVPDVFTQYGARRGHVMPSPLVIAASSHGFVSR